MKNIYNMKRTKVLLLAVAGMNILNCSAQPKDLDNYEYAVDSNVKRKVTIMVYNAIPSGEKNNKGDIAFSFFDGLESYFSYSQTYYDKYDNKLYEEYFAAGEDEPSRTVKTVWYNSEESKIQSIFERNIIDDYYSLRRTDYERDNQGNLIQITKARRSSVESEYEKVILEKYTYDNQGNRIEKKEFADNGDIASRTVYLHHDKNKNPMIVLVYDSNNQVQTEWKFEYYPNSQIKSEHRMSYKFGQLSVDLKAEYTFDNNGNMLSKRIEESSIGVIGIPDHIDDKEEKEDYIRENYYGENHKLKQQSHYFTFTHDEYNNETHVCSYSNYYDDEINRFMGLYNNNRSPCGRTASYKYNSNGDWIEKFVYNNRRNEELTHIITREIEYFE